MTDTKLLIQETQNLLRLHLGKSHSKYRKLKTTLKEARGKQPKRNKDENYSGLLSKPCKQEEW